MDGVNGTNVTISDITNLTAMGIKGTKITGTEECIKDYQEEIGHWGFFLPLSWVFVALLANLTLLTITVSTKELISLRFNKWIVSITVTDTIMVITFAVITVFTHLPHHDGHKPKDNNMNINHNFVVAWMVYIGSVSYYQFVALNLDRVHAIKFPVRYAKGTNRNVFCYIILCWVFGFIPSIAYLFDKSLEACSKKCDVCWIPHDNMFLAWFSTVTGCMIPAILMIISLLAIKMHFRNVEIIDRQQRIILRIMSALTISFLVCTIPITVVFIQSTITKPDSSKWMGIAYMMSISNSIINPAIFMTFSKQFRKAFKDFVERKKQVLTGKTEEKEHAECQL